MQVLISDTLPDEAVAILRAEGGLEVANRPDLGGADLLAAVAEADGLIVRSGTQVTADLLAGADRLRAVVRAGAGVDNVDLPAATRRGIVVMNTPGGNTVSTAELALALLLSLARHVPAAARSMADGEWNRKAFTGTQLAGKTLGVLGLGRVGREVVRRALAFGMTVLAYDPYVSDGVFEKLGIARYGAVGDLLPLCDAVTVHVPLTAATWGLIGGAELALMKPSAFLVNAARGGIVDEQALADALRAGRLAGAAVDVFESEPPENSPLMGAPNLVATPHLGASTAEAQIQVALDAARQMADALLRGRFRNAVNAPALDPKTAEVLGPYMDLAGRLGGAAVQLFKGPYAGVTLVYAGDLNAYDLRPVTASFLAGLLSPTVEETVNIVNAPGLAAERGMAVHVVQSADAADYVTLVTARVETPDGRRELSGTVYGRSDPRLVSLDGCRLEARPAGEMLFLANDDVPGVIGVIGTVCAEHGVNIADMTVGRLTPGGRAVTVLNIDSPPENEAMARLSRDANIRWLRRVSLPPAAR